MALRFGIVLFVFSAVTAPLFAQQDNETIMIFNLSVEEQISADEMKKFEYYSYIIPHTLANNLRKKSAMEIRRIEANSPTTGDIRSKQNRKALKKMAKDYEVQYIITGQCRIEGKQLTVRLHLYDYDKKDIIDIVKTSDETGAELKNIIDDCTAEIQRHLPVLERRGEKKEEKRYTGTSKFNAIYGKLHNLSFGTNAGYLFILGKWKGLYNNDGYISPYLAYDILKWVGVSVAADYILATGRNENDPNYSNLSLWGFTANGDFSLRFARFMFATLSAGIGISLTEMTFASPDSNPYNIFPKVEKSIDPYLSITAAIGISYKSLVIRIGSSYKGVMYAGTMLHGLSVFGGMGYHF